MIDPGVVTTFLVMAGLVLIVAIISVASVVDADHKRRHERWKQLQADERPAFEDESLDA